MRKQRPFRIARGHHGLAMVEIIIAIGVLAVVSMFVVEMFARATNLEHKARDLDRAVAAAQTAIERFKADPGAPIYDEAYFDADWRRAGSEDPRGFTLTASAFEGEGVRGMTVTVIKNAPYLLEDAGGTELFTLTGVAPDAAEGTP